MASTNKKIKKTLGSRRQATGGWARRSQARKKIKHLTAPVTWDILG